MGAGFDDTFLRRSQLFGPHGEVLPLGFEERDSRSQRPGWAIGVFYSIPDLGVGRFGPVSLKDAGRCAGTSVLARPLVAETGRVPEFTTRTILEFSFWVFYTRLATLIGGDAVRPLHQFSKSP